MNKSNIVDRPDYKLNVSVKGIEHQLYHLIIERYVLELGLRKQEYFLTHQ